jgi:aspartate aminotransferase-like enzyme
MDKRFKAHQTAGKAVREAVKALNLTVRSPPHHE